MSSTILEAPVDVVTTCRRPVTFEAAVPRHLVHRWAIAEVLITDWQRTGPGDRYLCGAQWPRAHSFHRVSHGRYDTMLVAETLRQAGIMLAHVAYGVPAAAHFVMTGLEIEVCEELTVGPGPCNLVLDVSVEDLRQSGDRTLGYRIDVDFRRDELLVARASGLVRFVDESAYPRLRWGGSPREPGRPHTPPGIAPGLVGHRAPEDVVLGRRLPHGGWPLRIDTGHPILFDHPLDHVPGTLVLEAVRQAGRVELADADARLAAFSARFRGYLDIDEPAVLSVVPGASGSGRVLDLEVRQHAGARPEVEVTATFVTGP